jgi:membrane-bound metal-dependent hydrolase YbcI (DUF457 family)
MPLPVAHGLIGASVVVLLRGRFSLRRDWGMMAFGAALGVLPDFDIFFSWVLGFGIKWHGSFTHSIFFAAVAGCVSAALRREGETRDIPVYAMATLSHGLLDVITRKEFGGAQLFWPFSQRTYRLKLFDYFEWYPNPFTDPLWAIFKRAFQISCYETLIFTPILAALLACRLWLNRQREKEAEPKGDILKQ